MPSPQVRTAIAGPDSNQVPSHSPSPRRRWIWIVLLWAVVYIPGLFSPPLLDDADSIHAEAARELIVRHDWTTLYIDGVRYLEKAPLMYWGMAVGSQFSGPRTGRPACRLRSACWRCCWPLTPWANGRSENAQVSGRQWCSPFRSGPTSSLASSFLTCWWRCGLRSVLTSSCEL